MSTNLIVFSPFMYCVTFEETHVGSGWETDNPRSNNRTGTGEFLQDTQHPRSGSGGIPPGNHLSEWEFWEPRHHLQDSLRPSCLSDRPVHLARGRQEVQGHPHDGSQDEQRRVSHGKQAITHVRQNQFQIFIKSGGCFSQKFVHFEKFRSS